MTTPEQIEKAFGSELEDLADFILARATDSLDVHIGAELAGIAHVHRLWGEECTEQADHYDRSFPCEEYERGLRLGIAWLKSKVEATVPPVGRRRSGGN